MTIRDRAVFLDRDGVLNDLVMREGKAVSPRNLEDFKMVPGAGASVARLRDAGFRVFVVTNQPDIARGQMERATLDRMLDMVRVEVKPDEVAVCPHDDADGCACRKPKPGMLHELSHRWGVDLGRSVMVGDTWRDMQAGRAAKCLTVLVGPGSDESADYNAATLNEAVDLILARMG